MVEMIVEFLRERAGVGLTVGLRCVIVIPNHRIHGARQWGENVLYGFKVVPLCLVRDITGMQAKLRVFLFHLPDDAFEIRTTLRAGAMGVVDDEEAERARGNFVARA